MMIKKNKKTNQYRLFIIGTILIASAALLFLYNTKTDSDAQIRSSGIVEQIHEASENYKDISSPEQLIPDYILVPEIEMPSAEIDGNLYIGTLTLPDLDLELPVMGDWSYPKLKIAPCLYSGSIYEHNAVIAAHNYNSHFGRLPELDYDSNIIFTDIEGNRFYFAVVVKEVLDPKSTEDMINSGFDLSLYTCTLSGTSRYTVRCSLIQPPDAAYSDTMY